MPKSILPHIGRRGWPSPLALDQLNLILGAHLPQNYGCLPKPPAVSVGGLASWQKRRATELLYENMAGRIRLSQLARECGLSVSHFARSFKVALGLSTHKWLVQRRVERSKDLLVQTHAPLVDIAVRTGFTDQAFFRKGVGYESRKRAFHRQGPHHPCQSRLPRRLAQVSCDRSGRRCLRPPAGRSELQPDCSSRSWPGLC